MEAGTAAERRRRGRRRSPTCCRRRRSSTATARRRAPQGRRRRGATSPSPRSATIVAEIGLGLIDLGIQPGDRVCLLANTRPEWTYADFAISSAGAVVVPIYPTNSPEECEWVTGNSESVASSARTPSRSPRSSRSATACPTCATIIVIDPRRRPTWPTRSRSTSCASAAAAATRAELEARTDGRHARRPLHLHLHVGHDRARRRAACSTHGNYRSRARHGRAERRLAPRQDDVVYLFLPLAHAFALLIQLGAFDIGATIAYWGGDTKQIVPELSRGPADLPPLGAAHLREALHARHGPRRRRSRSPRRPQVGAEGPRPARRAGEPVPAELQAALRRTPTSSSSRTSARPFGGRLREAVTGAAPIAKEILEFFYALRRAGASRATA